MEAGLTGASLCLALASLALFACQLRALAAHVSSRSIKLHTGFLASVFPVSRSLPRDSSPPLHQSGPWLEATELFCVTAMVCPRAWQVMSSFTNA